MTSEPTSDVPAQSGGDDADSGASTLAVREGRVVCTPGDGPATLTWGEHLEVVLDGQLQEGTSCSVRAGQDIVVRVAQLEPLCRYEVALARDRMSATLTVWCDAGSTRTLREVPPSAECVLALVEQPVAPPEPVLADAAAALQDAGVVFGVDHDAVVAAVAAPGSDHRIATGRAAVEGADGSLEALVDFQALRLTGVEHGTQLVRVIPPRPGTPGMDVTGRELAVRAVREARLRGGEGIRFDDEGRAVATVDGQPCFDGEGLVEVRHELVLEAVDTTTGDIDFCGSVRVTGSVQEGRRVVAKDQLVVDGNADRAWLESGSHMQVHGTLMKSTLRAGGDRAVAARIVDHVDDVPRLLAEAATRARELRDAAADRGAAEMSHGLSLQLVLERMYKPQMHALQQSARELEVAGERHVETAQLFASWHRALSTAAIGNLGAEEFNHLLGDMASLVQRMRELTEEQADLVVTYMQASEAEATGTVTLDGKGIFNSRVVAWGGLAAKQTNAVVRGGEIVSHGPVSVSEVGSPSGASMHVQLGEGALLQCDLVYAGTYVTSPSGSHRFNADRSNVKVSFGRSGMDVESLAA